MSNVPPKPAEAHLDPKAQSEHQDEVIVVPRGTKRARFIMTFLIVVLVLTTFTVSDQVLNVFSGKGSAATYASWRSPDGTQRVLNEIEFGTEMRRLDPLAPFVFGVSGREMTNDQVATFLVLEDAARSAGVRATDGDIQRFVKENFASKDQYLGYLRMYRLTGKEFEDLLRRVIRFQRYQALLASAVSVPDPAAVEKRWKAQHQEFALDYVELPTTTLIAEAKAQSPGDEELAAWYGALSEVDKAAYKTKELVSAELAAFPLEGALDATRLFAKYPRPADEDAEAKAREFHAGFSYVLYRRATPEPGKDFRRDFDEAKEEARVHAPIFNSISDWLASLAERAGRGETVDLAGEAAELGLTYRNQVDPLAQEAWRDLQVPWISGNALSRMFAPDQPVGLFVAAQVEAKGIVVGRVTGKTPSRQPEYAEVKDAVLDAWARGKAKELALAKLESIRDALGTRPDPSDATAPPFKPEVDREAFLKAVRDAGFEPQRRDWAEQSAPPPPEGDTAASSYFRQSPLIYTHKVGSVPKPEIDRAGSTAFLARLDGVRDPDLARMTPNDLQTIGRQLSAQELQLFAQGTLMSRESLEKRYQLDLASWHEQPAQ